MLKRAYIISFLILFADQISKIWVKTHMNLGEEFSVIGDWFIIHFTENPGMAFGMEFGGDIGKIALSSFRILAVIGLTYYIFKLVKDKAPNGVVYSFSLILAGALGNILDSALYGVIFDSGTTFNEPASSWMGYYGVSVIDFSGYSAPLTGCVVDMLYFPLLEGNFPSWTPIVGGDYFQFFRPVFNIADVAISVGVGMIIIFQRKFFMEEEDKTVED